MHAVYILDVPDSYPTTVQNTPSTWSESKPFIGRGSANHSKWKKHHLCHFDWLLVMINYGCFIDFKPNQSYLDHIHLLIWML
jgi:hypothetical protein